MISDRFVRNVLSLVLLLIFIILLTPAILTSIVVYKTDFLHGSEPDIVVSIINIFKDFKGFPNDIVALIMQTLPALICAICYRNNSGQTLNFVGYVVFFILILGAFLSFVLILFLDQSNSSQVNALVSGEEGIRLLEIGCEATLRTSITYLLLIVGLQIKTYNDTPK